MESDIFDVIEAALKQAGYVILDGDENSVIIHHPNSNSDYIIHVAETC